MAFCVASTIDAVQTKTDASHRRLADADRLAETLALDMTAWFTPTAENYFGKVSKAVILDALTEAGKTPAPAWPKAKKGELAAIAERELAGTGWLPEPLRGPAAEPGAVLDVAA